jgi:hypothetical protein
MVGKNRGTRPQAPNAQPRMEGELEAMGTERTKSMKAVDIIRRPTKFQMLNFLDVKSNCWK